MLGYFHCDRLIGILLMGVLAAILILTWSIRLQNSDFKFQRSEVPTELL